MEAAKFRITRWRTRFSLVALFALTVFSLRHSYLHFDLSFMETGVAFTFAVIFGMMFVNLLRRARRTEFDVIVGPDFIETRTPPQPFAVAQTRNIRFSQISRLRFRRIFGFVTVIEIWQNQQSAPHIIAGLRYVEGMRFVLDAVLQRLKLAGYNYHPSPESRVNDLDWTLAKRVSRM